MEFASIEAASENRYNYMAAYQIIASKLISQFTLLMAMREEEEEKRTNRKKWTGKKCQQ